MFFTESSLNELYQSTIEAFPHCPKRQHSTDDIAITKLEWLPFVGMKTLRVKGLAQNKANGHEYSPQIIFKQIQFHPVRDEVGLIEIIDSTGARYLLETLSYEDTQVLVRCNCNDFKWRFCHADHISHDLSGRDRAKYEALHRPGTANPDDSKGICKHIMVLGKSLFNTGIIE